MYLILDYLEHARIVFDVLLFTFVVVFVFDFVAVVVDWVEEAVASVEDGEGACHERGEKCHLFHFFQYTWIDLVRMRNSERRTYNRKPIISTLSRLLGVDIIHPLLPLSPGTIIASTI